MEQAVSTGDALVRRSLLVVAPLDPAAIAEAARAGADAVVIALGRGEAPHRRAEARSALSRAHDALRDCPADILLWSDAAGLDADLAAYPAEARLDGVVLRCDGPADAAASDAALTRWEAQCGRQPGTVTIEMALFTPREAASCAALAPSARTAALVLDEAALRADMAARGAQTPAIDDMLGYCRGAVVVAARALGVQAHGAAPSASGAAAYADSARRMGLRGALCWDVDAVAALNAGFAPAPDEVAAARDMLDAMEGALSAGSGAIAAGAGTMADLANLRQARAVLARAEAVERRDSARQPAAATLPEARPWS